MKFVTNIENQIIDCYFEDLEKFDKDILVKMEKEFKKLLPSKEIYVNLHGNVPFEIIAYVAEVQKHSILTANFIDDVKAKDFYKTLKGIK